MAKITKVIQSLLPKDLGSLGNLEEAKSVGALVPLEKQEVAPSRREFLKKAGSAVAQTAMPRGALATLVEKGLEPVAKKVIPKDIFDIPVFRKAVDSFIIKKSLKGSYGEDIKNFAEKGMLEEVLSSVDEDVVLPSAKKAYEFFRYGGDKKPNQLVKEIKKEYPDANNQELADLIGASNQAGLDYYQETNQLQSDIPGIRKATQNAIEGKFDWDLIPNMDKPKGFEKLSDIHRKYIYGMAIDKNNFQSPDGNTEWIQENTDSLINSGKTAFGSSIN